MSILELTGTLVFDPPDRSAKHKRQSEWKSHAMLLFDGEDHLYYSWFIERAYGLALVRPLRGAHVTFVNDRTAEISSDAWERLRATSGSVSASVALSTDVRTNGRHWWLRVESAPALEDMRQELGLRRTPFWTMHMTVGYANDRDQERSEQLHRSITSGLVHR